MRYRSSFFWLLAGFTVSTLAQEEGCDPDAPYVVKPPYGDEEMDPENLRALVDYWADNICITYSDGSHDKYEVQCKDACGAGDGEGASTGNIGCDSSNQPWSTMNGEVLLCGTDEDYKGLKIHGGYCLCNSPILDFLGEFFIESLEETGKILEKVVCPALKALDIVMAIGMAAIPPPGKAITGGMVAAVRSAKAYKYAYEAQDAAQQWADFFLGGLDFAGQAGCGDLGIPSKDDLIKKVFDPLTNVVDDVVPGGMNYDTLPCPAKGCKGCKGPNCKNDNEGEGENGGPSQTDKPAESTEAPTTTATSETASPTSSGRSCQELAAADKPDEQELQSEENTWLTPEPELRRRSYPINLQDHFFKRNDKRIKACDVDLSPFNWPIGRDWKKMSWIQPRKINFNNPDDCNDYAMDRPEAVPPKDPATYATEHVLEWQTVGRFFAELSTEITTQFDNPDPDTSAATPKVDWCEYWRESWDLENGQTMMDAPNPSLDTKILVKSTGKDATSQENDRKRPPFEFIQSHYPWMKGKEVMGVDEFFLLESMLNSVYKQALFGDSDIRSEDGMRNLVQGKSKEPAKKGKTLGLKDLDAIDQGKAAMRRMRHMVGTLKYMQDDAVKAAFVKQKNRMGEIIRYIDDNLGKFPRVKPGSSGPFTPWQPQGLGDRWNSYIDEVFEKAKKKATDFMALWLKELDDEWNTQKKRDEYKADKNDDKKEKDRKAGVEKRHKDLLATLKKLNDEWDKVKEWKNPFNPQTQPSPTPSPAPTVPRDLDPHRA